MKAEFLTLLKFEFKNSLHSKSKIIFNAFFLLINLALFPFIIDPNPITLKAVFLPILLINLSLTVVIITQNIFYEDLHDGTLDLLASYGIKLEKLFLVKLLSCSLEFLILTIIIFPLAGVFYDIEMKNISKLWLCMIPSIPSMTGISVFTSLLTLNLRNAYILAIILVFPLLITILIFLSLACNSILGFNSELNGLSFVAINFGLALLLTPLQYLLVKLLD